MSMTREQLQNGIRFESGLEHWGTSYHETDSFGFVPEIKRINCDHCGGHITAGSLYSIGTRQVNIDAPIYGNWVDRVHIECCSYKTVEEALSGSDPSSYAGFSFLPEEEKIKFMKIAGAEIDLAKLNTKKVFDGVVCMVMGEFSGGRHSLRQKIEQNGAVVIEKLLKSTHLTHIVLGSAGRTDYGQPTGAKSKMYKEAAKRRPKPIVVDIQFINAAITKGLNILDYPVVIEKEKPEKPEKEEKPIEEDSTEETLIDKTEASEEKGKNGQEKEETIETSTKSKKRKTEEPPKVPTEGTRRSDRIKAKKV